MKQIDLTKIPVDQLYLGWLSQIVKQTKPKILIITKKQSLEFFNISGEPWKYYRGVEIKIK